MSHDNDDLDLSCLDKSIGGAKSFGVADLGGADSLDVEIERVEQRTMADGERKLAVFFKGHGKPAIFGRGVVYKSFRKFTGTDDATQWPGKRLNAYETTAQYKTDTFEVVRYRAVKRPAATTSANGLRNVVREVRPADVRAANMEEPEGLPERFDDAGREGEGDDSN